MRGKISLTLALAAVLVSGCTHTARTEVRATASALEIPTTSYRLTWTSGADPAVSFALQEAGTTLRTALAAQGLHEVYAESPPDLLVVVDCDLGARRSRRVPHTDLPPPTRDSDGKVREMNTHVTTSYTEEAAYEKQLTVTAYENRPSLPNAKSQVVWRVEVSIDDASPDLARYVPGLVAAGAGYLNTNSHETTKIVMSGFGI